MHAGNHPAGLPSLVGGRGWRRVTALAALAGGPQRWLGTRARCLQLRGSCRSHSKLTCSTLPLPCGDRARSWMQALCAAAHRGSNGTAPTHLPGPLRLPRARARWHGWAHLHALGGGVAQLCCCERAAHHGQLAGRGWQPCHGHRAGWRLDESSRGGGGTDGAASRHAGVCAADPGTRCGRGREAALHAMSSLALAACIQMTSTQRCELLMSACNLELTAPLALG